MKTDYQLHYQILRGSIGEKPHEKLINVCFEIRTPTFTLRGYLDLLGDRLSDSKTVSTALRDYHREFSRIVEQLITATDVARTEGSWEKFVGSIPPITNELSSHVEEINSIEEDLAIVFPVPNLPDIFIRNAHHIWAIVDAVTNPDLKLPAHISEWLEIRGEVQERAQSGGFDVMETLLNALNNPLEDIRREAVTLIGQLKHPNSVSAVISALEDASPQVRGDAVYTLEQLRDIRAVEPLKKLLNDEKGFVHQRAARAIESLGG